MSRVWIILPLLAGCVSSERPQIRWRGFEGTRAYLFSSNEQTPNGGGALEVEVVMRGARGEPSRLEIRRARAGSTFAALSEIVLDPVCARAFDGDATVLGRVVIRTGIDPHAAVPPCVPENLFGAVTDLIAILLVQSPRFSIDSLRVAGDSARFTGFEARWSRPDPEMRANVVARGGTIRLVRLSADEAVVQWRPDPMEVTIVRRVSPGRAAVMRGQEQFGLELRLDPRQGAVRSARAIEDRLDMRFWLLESDTLPSGTAPMSGGGAALVIRRTLELVPAPGASFGAPGAERVSEAGRTWWKARLPKVFFPGASLDPLASLVVRVNQVGEARFQLGHASREWKARHDDSAPSARRRTGGRVSHQAVTMPRSLRAKAPAIACGSGARVGASEITAGPYLPSRCRRIDGKSRACV